MRDGTKVLHLEILSDDGSLTKAELMLPFKDFGHVSSNLTAGKVWPACIVLAHFILHHKTRLAGQRIFEFGSGIAVPSLAARKSGIASAVILQELPVESLLSMQRTIFAANNLEAGPPSCVQVPLRWGELPETFHLDHPGDIGLFVAADCLYEKNDFADLVATVAFFLERYRGVPFVMCYQDRNLLYSIDELFEHWGLKSELIPLDTFGFDAHRFVALNETANIVDEFPLEDVDSVLVMLEVRRKDEPFVFAAS